ncbi:keto-deoxy-phosphogluconate aldolase, partial [Thioclava sp. BHET1]
PVALEAIRIMGEVEGGVVGGGTIMTPADARAAKAAGAKFGVSPGATERLLDACEAEDLAMLPGAATASEVMALLERGYTVQKFFPAEASGGAPALKAIGAPIPQVKFCPTGGVSLKNANDYLSLGNI